jgi:hypothetical protein
MRILIAFLLAAFAFPPHADYRKHGAVLLNDLSVTPGKVRTTDVKAVCSEKTPQSATRPRR